MNKLFLIVFLFLFSVSGFSQTFPQKPSPEKHISDYAKILDSSQCNSIDTKLSGVKNSKDITIVIVTVDTLHGYTSERYKKKLKKKWGLGSDNVQKCVFVFVKPMGGIGQRYVSVDVSKDLDNIISDHVQMEIVDEIMLPNFRKGNYYDALIQCIDKITTTINK